MKAENQCDDSELCTEEALPGEETNMKNIIVVTRNFQLYDIYYIYTLIM
jgi:hypothetical protein